MKKFISIFKSLLRKKPAVCSSCKNNFKFECPWCSGWLKEKRDDEGYYFYKCNCCHMETPHSSMLSYAAAVYILGDKK
jgi:hypothetical protein